MLEDLQAQRHTLTNRLDALRSELKECNGEAYRGCWLDSATNRTGKRYTRLRWFTSLKPKKKGCRILRGEELATATKAIALWQEYERVEAALNRLNEAWASIEAKASRRLAGKTQTAPTPGKSLASVQEWQPADTFTHQGKSFEVVGRGNRYLKLRDQGGAIARWDTQEQVLWYDAAQPAAPRLAQKLAARRQAG
jgi:hypothetical protein